MPGLETYGRTQALESLFNPSETTYVALLEVLPVDSAGEVEVSPTGYARILSNTWTTANADGVTSRCNAAGVTFGPFPDAYTTRGWAIYDAPVGGNLIASGLFFDTGGGMAGEVSVPINDEVQFQPGDLCISLSQDCPIEFGDGDGDGDGDTCSPIASITVDTGGGPVAWNIGDPPENVAPLGSVTIVVTLTAPSTDMGGFSASVTSAASVVLTPLGAVFTLTYSVPPGPSGQVVTIENLTNTPTCTYALGTVTAVS